MKNKVQLFFFLVILYVASVCVLAKNTPHYIYGDGIEYVLMTESIHNHFSPNILAEDISRYIAYLDKNGLTVHKRQVLEYFEDRIASATANPKSFDFDELEKNGYYLASNDKIYSYHFWAYSLLNVPARAILYHLKADIRICFLATNLFFFFWGIWFLLSLKRLLVYQRLILLLLLIFSPALWYIDWAHAEVFGGILTFIAAAAFFADKKYHALLFFSLASMHYPPLFIPAGYVLIVLLMKHKFAVSNLFKLFICSFWVILPAIFYYFHFGSINLISGTDYLSTDYVSIKRLFSFFFDINQGMILTIPLLLLMFIAILIKDILQLKNLNLYPFIVCILLMSLFFMQMGNWNHDHAVANRYVVWNASIIIVIFFFRSINLKKVWFISIFSFLIISQVLTIFSQQEFNKIHWHSLHFNKVSEYVLDHYPHLYNPEPLIFKYRYNPFELSTSDSVFTYTDKNNIITKMMVKEGSIGQLIKRGISKSAVEELESNLDYYLGYAYVNKNDLDRMGYVQANDTLIPYIEKINKAWMINDIKSRYTSPVQYPIIQKRALEWGISEDSALNRIVENEYQYGRKRYFEQRAR